MLKTTLHQTAKLIKIDFDEFRLYNSNPRNSFEDLSYFLFCRRFGASNGIFRHKNQAGIETNPIKVNRDLVGFQSKFFDNHISKSQLIDSLKKAKGRHPKINKIIFYINKEFSEGHIGGLSQDQKSVEDEAKSLGVKLEWVVPSHFEILLNEPTNFDLAQVYFGAADQFGFIKNGINHKIQTFLQSEEYLELPLTKDGKTLKRPAASILRSKQKSFLITGHPGSGKSIFTHALFREFAGLDTQTENQMANLLIRNQAVPMLINLKDCTSESLENLIRVRQVDSNVRGNSLGFIYLFDGLDELNESRADQILGFARELEQQSTTKKIIISCRSGNLNRIKVPVYLNQLIEFQFCDLDSSHIDKFFEVKKDKEKLKCLSRFRKINPKVLNAIKDILLIRLLWETVGQLGPNSTVADLIEQKVSLLLDDPDHRKNVDSLNLLDVKSDEIIALNQEISFQFQQKFQFRFPQKELQEVILNKYPRLDYRSANELLSYLSNLFFDSGYPDDGGGAGPGFIYQHRRYQEFFFTQRLKIEYEKDPSILRRLDILSNREFFEGYFLPYLRKEYERKENIVGLLDLNLIDVYLGNHKGYGVDDAYYLSSSEFIPALANQSPYLIDELLDSENFQLKSVLFIDIDKLKIKFQKWDKDPDSYNLTDYLSSTWTAGLGALLSHAVTFWEEGNKEMAKKFLQNLDEVHSIYSDNKFFKRLRKERRPPDDPFWNRWEDYIFTLICIRGKKIDRIFANLIRGNYRSFTEEGRGVHGNNEGKAKLVKSFFRVAASHKITYLVSSIDQMDDYEFTMLLDALHSYNLLKLFIKNKGLQTRIKSSLISRNLKVSESSFFLAFYKRYLNIAFGDDETEILKELSKTLRSERRVDWSFRDVPLKFAFISFGLGENSFDDLKPDPTDHFRYYNELDLYAALFDSFVKVLEKKKTIEPVLRDYLAYVYHHDDRLGLYLKVKISFLWAEIFNISDKLAFENLSILKTRLLQDDTNVVPYSFHYHLAVINKKLFDKVVNETDLIKFENKLKNPEDYQSLVNDCFTISIFYSNLNEEKSRFYFIKGLKDSVLRHGWRKDTLVSYQLVDGLEILWRNNCESREKLSLLTQEVFSLALRVGEFTDGKGTWQGPYNVVDVVSKFDIELASTLMEKLIEEQGYENFSNKVVTSVLLGKVRLGYSLGNIESEMSKYKRERDFEGKPRSDIYEEKITVYIAVSESDLYQDQERQDSFYKAYDLVEEMIREGITYYLSDAYFEELKGRYILLCQKYSKNPNVEIKERDQAGKKFSQKEFVKSLNKINTKREISNLYKKIEDGIVLTEKSSWEALLRQTYKVSGNITPFINQIEKSSFPHADFFRANSKYLHFGLAVAMEDINMKAEATKCLYQNTGHGGFSNMMRVYEAMGDRQMCRKLFTRYLQLCHLLSD